MFFNFPILQSFNLPIHSIKSITGISVCQDINAIYRDYGISNYSNSPSCPPRRGGNLLSEVKPRELGVITVLLSLQAERLPCLPR
jgi:hypothetical protein